MGVLNTTIIPTAITMAGGAAVSGGSGTKYKVSTAVNAAVGDTWEVALHNRQTDVTYSVGMGAITGLADTFCFTYDQKVYLLAGFTTYFSAVGQPTVFNDVNATGNGFVSMANAYQTPEALTAIGPFQGQLVFFSRHTTQIWSINADPDLWQLKQVLQNIGTMAPASVQPLGGFDLFFLSDTGIRSLRVRDINLNAFVDDLGSPIDALIQAQLIASPANALAALAIVEPSANRYWLYLNGIIYALSYFPSSKVVAWSTYTPTAEAGATFTVLPSTNGNFSLNVPCYDSISRTIALAVPWNTNASTTAADICTAINATTTISHYTASHVGGVITLVTVGVVNVAALAVFTLTGDITVSAITNRTVTFTPTKFLVFNGTVYAKAGNIVYMYGCSLNELSQFVYNIFDSTAATLQTPWLDYKTPGQRKTAKGFQFALTGAWTVSASMDPISAIYETVYQPTVAPFQSFDQGIIPWSTNGTHQSILAVTTGHTAAVFSGVIPHYSVADEE